jgi:hypothetical protein
MVSVILIAGCGGDSSSPAEVDISSTTFRVVVALDGSPLLGPNPPCRNIALTLIDQGNPSASPVRVVRPLSADLRRPNVNPPGELQLRFANPAPSPAGDGSDSAWYASACNDLGASVGSAVDVQVQAVVGEREMSIAAKAVMVVSGPE